MATQGILLESGTNEVEVLEFFLNGQSLGVNVAKIQAIIQYEHKMLTKMPLAHPSLAGMYLFRQRTIPMIDLHHELGTDPPCLDQPETDQDQPRIVLVTEFNQSVNAFLVDGVNRIHRISWQDISPLSPVLADSSAQFTGSVQIEGHEILILDMEKIISGVFPAVALDYNDAGDVKHPRAANRGEVRIILAEDSTAIRKMIVDVLQAGNYTDVTSFDNGRAAYDEIVRRKTEAEADGTDPLRAVSMVISDIEMPQMDGLTLCRNIKSGLGLPQLPVALFSSLINDQMAAKCRSVGADGYVSKPQVRELVQMIDSLCLQESEPAST